MKILAVCLRRGAMYRRAISAERARQELAAISRYKPLTRPGERRTVLERRLRHTMIVR